MGAAAQKSSSCQAISLTALVDGPLARTRVVRSKNLSGRMCGALVTAFNDMLCGPSAAGEYSARQSSRVLAPRCWARTAQVAGGGARPCVTAGVTQGQPDPRMELSLLLNADRDRRWRPPSPLSHNMFDGRDLPWRYATRSCRAPADRGAALWPSAGTISCPPGRCAPGLPNDRKA